MKHVYFMLLYNLANWKKINMPEEAGKKEEKELKPCCACPETKKVRDEWWVFQYIKIK